VLFGGVGSGGILDDTWEWDGTAWSQFWLSCHLSGSGFVDPRA
jgi:hypothetical protein